MVRVEIAKQVVKGPYADDALTVAMTAADPTNDHAADFFEGMMLLAINTHATTPYNVTVTSAPDSHGRTNDLVESAIAAGQILIFGPFTRDGWRQTDGSLYFEADNAAVKFAVIDPTV